MLTRVTHEQSRVKKVMKGDQSGQGKESDGYDEGDRDDQGD